jgi:uncharacterized protein with HEPN domain
MLDAAREESSFLAGRSRADLDSDRMLSLAPVKLIEIIGEAATHVSVKGRSTLPGIPWQDIVGMRNRLIHAYNDVDLEVVWSTVKEDLPPLIEAIEATLPPG